ncbi:MAG: SdrD B-like domain-containing protein [Phycisphaerae bacterium]|jgi:hypothetical protein|nr:SdrD B-like domain-containing protein [Phycisphaerae bacterium]
MGKIIDESGHMPIFEALEPRLLLDGTIAGQLWNDFDADGVNDASESGLNDWIIELTDLADGATTTTATADGGLYSFDALPPGNYEVRQIDQSGWVRIHPTGPSYHAIELIDDALGIDFGNVQPGSISGVKFDDLDGDGVKDAGEPGLNGWTIELVDSSSGLVINTAVTATDAVDGEYVFTDVIPGDYEVREIAQAGWVQTFPATSTYSLTLSGGDDLADRDFGNTRPASVSGQKFDDFNANGLRDPGEPGLDGCTIELVDATTGLVVDTAVTTSIDLDESGDIDPESESGLYSFTVLNPVPVPVESYTSTIDNILGTGFYRGHAKWLSTGSVDDAYNGTAHRYRGTLYNAWWVFEDLPAGSYQVWTSWGTPTLPAWSDVPYVVYEGGTVVSGKYQAGTSKGTFVADQTELPTDLQADGVWWKSLGTHVVERRLAVEIHGPQGVPSGLPVDEIPFAFADAVHIEGVLLNYIIREVNQPGWVQSFPAGQRYGVGLEYGQSIPGKDFGNYQLASISGQKFEDLDGDGVKDTGELGLDGWTIELVDPATGDVIETQVTASLDVDESGAIDPETEMGLYSFEDLIPGDYELREVLQDGWAQTYPGAGPYSPTLISGEAITDKDFGNAWVGSISGQKFEDLNGDGIKDTDELGLDGWTIELVDADTAVVLDSQLTSGGGLYSFVDLVIGNYEVREVQKIGWVQTLPATSIYTTSLAYGQHVTDKDFGNQPLSGAISGRKFEDVNANSVRDAGEPGLDGWTIELVDPSSGLVIDTRVTFGGGTYSFGELMYGSYIVREIVRNGWIPSMPDPSGHTVDISPGETLDDVHFGNYRAVSIFGQKFEDLDGNGIRDIGEAVLDGWVIELVDPATGNVIAARTTAGGGFYSFSGLTPGDYELREVLQDGWVQTCPDPGVYSVSLMSGDVAADKDFGNFPEGGNRAPTGILLTGDSVPENAPNITVIGTVTGVDPDGDTLTFTLTDNAGGRFGLVGSVLVVADGSMLDYESATSHDVTVEASDGEFTRSEVFTINILNVNEFPPTDISLSSTVVSEHSPNGTLVGTLSGSDLDEGALVFSLTDDAGGRFAVSGTELEIANGTLLDYETATSHVVTIQASDGEYTHTETFTINVTDVNESPTDISLSSDSVLENAPNGIVIGTLSGLDPEGNALTFSLQDDAGGRFKIEGALLMVADGSLLDYDVATSHDLVVGAYDGEFSYGETLTIYVMDWNEAPTDISLTGDSVEESAPNVTIIGTFSGVDPDGDTLTFSLTDNADRRFGLVGNVLVVADGSMLDYESATTHDVTVQTSDGNLTYSETFAIHVTNIDDDPHPTLQINDVSLTEGDSGTKNFNFTVTLSAFSSDTVSVNYETVNDTATAAADYVAVSGTLIFIPGQTDKTISILVTGDTTSEANEQYFVYLGGATNAAIADSRGVGIILNDDGYALDVELRVVDGLHGDDHMSDADFTSYSSIPNVSTGSSYYAEVWLRDISTGHGIISGTVDITYTTAYADVIAISNGGVYTALPSGAIHETQGLIDNLGGGTLSTLEGVTQWVRLGWVEMLSTEMGEVTFTLGHDFSPMPPGLANPQFENMQAIEESLATVEYESPFGRYPLDTIGEGNSYKSRRGYDTEGFYTEYLMEDDEGTGGQYAAMDFNGWVTTDAGCRIYDSGVVHVWDNIEQESAGSVPDWSGAYGGYPTGINTCGNQNDLLYKGQGLFDGDAELRNHRGEDWQLLDWGVGAMDWGVINWTGTPVAVTVDPAPFEVAGRHIFYNNSAMDGSNPAAGPPDDDAIDPSKQALLPGQTVTSANYTSYSRGINGIMVDIGDLPGTPTAGDFGIRVNEATDPDTWSAGPAPNVSVRPDAGVGGSDRVTLIWADGAILNQWVEVTVLSDANGGGLGLAQDDVFYFANLVGDCDGDGQVGGSDYGILVGEFGQRGGVAALAADLNGDCRVDLTDFAIMRGSFGNSVLVPTIPADPADQTIRFAVIGDYGSGSIDEADVADLVTSLNPDFVVTTGDNRYGFTTFDEVVGQYYCSFLTDAGSGAYCSGGDSPTNAFFPSTGNHDYWDGGSIDEYLDYFTLPGAGVDSSDTSGSERYYDFIQGPLHFFALDSEEALTDPADMADQQDWLQTQLAVSTTPWQVVYMHHPPYSSGMHGSSIEMQWPYADWGADFVMSGHDHDYERIEADGIVYFVNGLGGSSRYPFDIPIGGSQVRYTDDFGAMVVDASPDAVNFRFINRGGLVIDDYTHSAQPAGPAIASAPPAENNPAGTVVGTFGTIDPDPGEPIAAAAATGVPVVSQPLDLLMELPSAADYISEPQAIAFRSSATTLQRAATTAYDLRPLSDAPEAGAPGDDLLADILAEAALLAVGY